MIIHRDTFLAPFQDKTVRRWCLALSGGMDSVALLHFLRYKLHTSLPIVALHVNHHLQAAADAWQTFCVELCENWQVPLQILSVDIVRGTGDSLEATARAARYEALFSQLRAGDVLLTAHHADDQAETVLLQLLRGAGPKGLAAMPLQIENKSGVIQYRPFLNTTRAAIAMYVKENQLKHIDDLSNEDIAFDRNYLRQHVIPLLQQRWPSYAKTLSRSAQLSAELINWATPLWQTALETCVDAQKPKCLDRRKLMRFSSYECSEVLRLWLEQQGFALPSLAQMQQLLNLVYQYRADSQAAVKWGDVVIRVYQQHLYALSLRDTIPCLGVFPWTEFDNTLRIENLHLQAKKIEGQGIALTYLQDCEVRFREEGERFHAAGRVGSHPLKKLFQEWGIPPWQRARIPLIYAQGELIAVIGFACHADKLAAENELGIEFSYQEIATVF